MLDSQQHEIRSLDLFRNMDEDNYAALMKASYVQNFPPMIDLIAEGDPSDFLHIIVGGSVELFSAWNGHETSMATIRPVSTFILAATIRDAPYLMSGRTLEKSRVVLVPSQDVRDIFSRDGDFARAVVTELAHCFRSVVKSSKDLKLRTSRERLANYLLRQQQRMGGERTFQLQTEKRRLASYLGMTPENLSRAIKGLRPHGIEVNGANVTITDEAALLAFAQPNPLIDDHAS